MEDGQHGESILHVAPHVIQHRLASKENGDIV